MLSAHHRAYRHVTWAWLFFIVTHVAALAAMALILEPGLRPTITAPERASYIASHAWAWHFGWIPWQLSALSNLLVSITLARWLLLRGKPGGRWALLSLLFTVAAIIPEQWGELVFMSRYIEVARGATTASGVAAFMELERWATLMTGPCANTSYVAMTMLWIVALWRASGTVDARLLTGLGVATCVPFLGACVVIARATQQPDLAGLENSIPFNAVAFPLLMLWSVVAVVHVRRLHRSDFPGHDDGLHALRPAWLAWLCDLRDVLRPLPFLELESNVRDVVYLNWLVPTERARQFVPPELELQVFGDRTAFSILTYGHGGFGPRVLGPLRRLLPSPKQSNWRFYVKPEGAVYFVKSVLSSALYTVGSRVMSDSLPAHYAAHFEHQRDGAAIRTAIATKGSNAPDLTATARTHDQRELTGEWATTFDDWGSAVEYLVEQNCAVAPMPALGIRLASDIDIPIAVADVVPAECTVQSEWLAQLTEGCTPLCFVVPQVVFRALGERAANEA